MSRSFSASAVEFYPGREPAKDERTAFARDQPQYPQLRTWRLVVVGSVTRVRGPRGLGRLVGSAGPGRWRWLRLGCRGSERPDRRRSVTAAGARPGRVVGGDLGVRGEERPGLRPGRGPRRAGARRTPGAGLGPGSPKSVSMRSGTLKLRVLGPARHQERGIPHPPGPVGTVQLASGEDPDAPSPRIRAAGSASGSAAVPPRRCSFSLGPPGSGRFRCVHVLCGRRHVCGIAPPEAHRTGTVRRPQLRDGPEG